MPQNPENKGKRKPIVEGMYMFHEQYSPPKMSDVAKREVQAEQHRRVVSKRKAAKQGRDALKPSFA